MIEKLIRILTNGLYLVCAVGVAALPTTAFAQACVPSESQTCITCNGNVCYNTNANTTIYTTGTQNTYDTTNLAASQQVNIYSTQIIGHMQDGPTLYDQIFNVAYSSALLGTVQGVLTANGASSFIGTLLSDSTSPFSTAIDTGAPVVTGTETTFSTTLYIGPTTFNFGDNLSFILNLADGTQDYNTVATSIIHQTITTTTTNTFLTTDVYELVGVPAVTSVPEPATMLLLGFGLVGLAGVRRLK